MIEESREVRIVFDVPEGIRTRFATNLVAQHTDHEFIVTFFEVLPPILVGTPEMQKQQVEAITEVRGTCLARIVIPASRMPDFIQVLQENHRRYLSGREGNECLRSDGSPLHRSSSDPSWPAGGSQSLCRSRSSVMATI
jgi:hypothetical protein